MSDCIFCKIVSGEEKSYAVWEDDHHQAFLSIFPNTPGITVVIPKAHYPSYHFNLPDNILVELILASKKVANLLDKKLEDVGRTAMVFEGFGVDHVHAKLIPMHGTAKMREWKPIKSNVDKFFEKYEGYISSHDYKLADPHSLDEISELIRS